MSFPPLVFHLCICEIEKKYIFILFSDNSEDLCTIPNEYVTASADIFKMASTETADLEQGIIPPNLPEPQPSQPHVSIVSITEEGDVVKKDSVITNQDNNVQNENTEAVTATETADDTDTNTATERAVSRGSNSSDKDVSSHGGDTASTLSGGEINHAFMPDSAAASPTSGGHVKGHTRTNSSLPSGASSPISQVLYLNSFHQQSFSISCIKFVCHVRVRKLCR